MVADLAAQRLRGARVGDVELADAQARVVLHPLAHLRQSSCHVNSPDSYSSWQRPQGPVCHLKCHEVQHWNKREVEAAGRMRG